ncbi:hypothetical protein BLNAU_1779 [Blattamonas nauphoetae]|uniref:VWFA domain-containing protein n=1 Tax=Blattamonas nauphoetae TaxID=2049346 RepID=A0ABQ9YHV2_9EUKA|nr:hypothetical protein BLNAU_1779 [Blattamonas nauphoetae]
METSEKRKKWVLMNRDKEPPSVFKARILKAAFMCWECDNYEEAWTVADVQGIHRLLDNDVPDGTKEELLTMAMEKIIHLVVLEDADHGITLHLFPLNFVVLMRRTISFSPHDDNPQDIVGIHIDIDGDVPHGNATELRKEAIKKLVMLFQDDDYSRPNISGYEGNLGVIIDTSKEVKLTEQGGEAQVLINLQSPILDDAAPQFPLSICFLLCTSKSMAEDGKLEDALESIKETVTTMIPTDYISIVTYSSSPTVLLAPYRVGTVRGDSLVEDPSSMEDDMFTYNLSVTDMNSDIVDPAYSPIEYNDVPSLGTILQNIMTGSSSNIDEGIKAAIQTVAMGGNDGPIGTDFRRVIVIVSDGIVNAGLTDINFIGANTKRYLKGDFTGLGEDSLSEKNISISFVGIGINTAAEENVMRTLSRVGRGEYYWCTTSHEITTSIQTLVKSNKIRTTRGVEISYIDIAGCEMMINKQLNRFVSTELTDCVGFSTRARNSESQALCDMITSRQQVKTANLDNPVPGQVKIRAVDIADLVSGEERKVLLNIRLWLSPTFSPMFPPDANETYMIGGIMLYYHFLERKEYDVLFCPVWSKLVFTEPQTKPARIDPFSARSMQNALTRHSSSSSSHSFGTLGSRSSRSSSQVEELNDSVERLQLFTMLCNSNQIMRQAGLECERGKLKEALTMLKAQRTKINQFAAPRLLSAERVYQKDSVALLLKDGESFDTIPIEVLFTRVSYEDKLELLRWHSYCWVMKLESRLETLISFILNYKDERQLVPMVARQTSLFFYAMACGNYSYQLIRSTPTTAAISEVDWSLYEDQPRQNRTNTSSTETTNEDRTTSSDPISMHDARDKRSAVQPARPFFPTATRQVTLSPVMSPTLTHSPQASPTSPSSSISFPSPGRESDSSESSSSPNTAATTLLTNKEKKSHHVRNVGHRLRNIFRRMEKDRKSHEPAPTQPGYSRLQSTVTPIQATRTQAPDQLPGGFRLVDYNESMINHASINDSEDEELVVLGHYDPDGEPISLYAPSARRPFSPHQYQRMDEARRRDRG